MRLFLAAVIRGTPGLELGAICSAGSQALLAFSSNPPDAALISLFLPDMTGTEWVGKAKGVCPKLRSILTVPDKDLGMRHGFEILEAGARGFLLTNCGAEELACAIHTVHCGGAYLSSEFAMLVADYFGARGAALTPLTRREREVLQCLARGLTQQEVAVTLGISVATVERHVHNLLPKLNARSTAQAISAYLNPSLPLSPKSPLRDRMDLVPTL
jgi:DNA-binding NarL/FixJ family response regulator